MFMEHHMKREISLVKTYIAHLIPIRTSSVLFVQSKQASKKAYTYIVSVFAQPTFLSSLSLKIRPSTQSEKQAFRSRDDF
jgi:hypothetical protein